MKSEVSTTTPAPNIFGLCVRWFTEHRTVNLPKKLIGG
jgi:hypothetical protein